MIYSALHRQPRLGFFHRYIIAAWKRVVARANAIPV